MEIDFLIKVLQRFKERLLPLADNGGSISTSRSRKRAKRGAGVNRLCELAGVSQAGYYRFRRRRPASADSMDLRDEIQVGGPLNERAGWHITKRTNSVFVFNTGPQDTDEFGRPSEESPLTQRYAPHVGHCRGPGAARATTPNAWAGCAEQRTRKIIYRYRSIPAPRALPAYPDRNAEFVTGTKSRQQSRSRPAPLP